MKKLLLGLGAVSIAALPVLAVVSCGSTTTAAVELKVTATTKGITQVIIDKAVTAYNKDAATEAEKLAALNTVFTGVTVENMKNFTVVATAKDDVKKTVSSIVLTANNGFTFADGEKTLSAIVSLKVTATTTAITQKTIDDAVIAYNKDAATEAEKLAALQTVFTGLTSVDDLKNFTVVAKDGSIVLTANEGFTFEGGLTLSAIVSLAELNVKVKSEQEVQGAIDKAVADYNKATTDADKLAALNTVFTGLTSVDDLKNFTVVATAKDVNANPAIVSSIVLTAKDGFIFANGTKTLSTIAVIVK